MTSQVASTGERWRTFRPTLTWAVIALVGFLLLYLVAGRVERIVARWPQSGHAAVSPTHCAEFIDLAKATYGVQWKSRLDPSDTTCANEIQQAWEQQRISRDAEAERAREMSRSPDPIAARPAPPPDLTSQAPPARAETYCLNVISLAKAKYGADWTSKVDPADQAACVRP
jgi:hypothetical protein